MYVGSFWAISFFAIFGKIDTTLTCWVKQIFEVFLWFHHSLPILRMFLFLNSFLKQLLFVTLFKNFVFNLVEITVLPNHCNATIITNVNSTISKSRLTAILSAPKSTWLSVELHSLLHHQLVCAPFTLSCLYICKPWIYRCTLPGWPDPVRAAAQTKLENAMIQHLMP